MIIDIERADAEQTAYWIIFSGDRIVAKKQQQALLKSSWRYLRFIHHYSDQVVHIGELDDAPCYSVDLGLEALPEDEYETVSLRSLFMSQNESVFSTVARAWQLILFRRTHRYCGKCGSAMQQVDWEMAMHCHSCHHRCYPRVSPCIIVSIRKGDKILLAQGKAQRERKMFSTLAGFVESGESLEQAVHREVFEEVGIKIKNLQYFSSQPWPFPHSLMMGFLAEHDEGDIEVDGHEILEAHWYDVNALPIVPPSMSIAGKLIDHTIQEIKGHK
ncbi:NAD(+) diphosphatase [Aliiglaciecola sp. LCG003]|uniref:NAD(+) diphosphatase n=1 Tax=Aliiglaciecola sp. LCG003 TaxID=3053655 RepID=UPI0025723C5B|nr:NAD(+) diphosphatase [Aliiglaciecola sp. LCG003]WJG09783.1 NAD(+) diphosphatase [Aliiglaciecola sp. LCG003]